MQILIEFINYELLYYVDDEENEKYLVDFQRKVLYSTPAPEKNEHSKTKSSIQEEDIVSSRSSETVK